MCAFNNNEFFWVVGYNWDCNGNKIGKMQQELKQNPLSQQFPGKLLSKSMCYSVFIFPFIAQSMVIILDHGKHSLHIFL